MKVRNVAGTPKRTIISPRHIQWLRVNSTLGAAAIAWLAEAASDILSSLNGTCRALGCSCSSPARISMTCTRRALIIDVCPDVACDFRALFNSHSSSLTTIGCIPDAMGLAQLAIQQPVGEAAARLLNWHRGYHRWIVAHAAACESQFSD
jgi:hypothetical protein